MNKSAVMKRAWAIYRTLIGDRAAKLSAALKQAWAEVKNPAEQTAEPKPAQRVIMCDDNIHKWVITNEEIVEFFELMGGRWVRLGQPENWSKELIYEEFGAETEIQTAEQETATPEEQPTEEIKMLLPASLEVVPECTTITLVTKKTRKEKKVGVLQYDKKRKIIVGTYTNRYGEFTLGEFDMTKYDYYL